MWSFEYSVEAAVNREFAWKFWTDVSKWPVIDPSVESVTLNGRFRSGAVGTTKPRGGEQISWRIAEVFEGYSAIIEIPAPGAMLRLVWKFEDTENGRTRITQIASMTGTKASDYLGASEELQKGIPEGMRKLAKAMEKVASGRC